MQHTKILNLALNSHETLPNTLKPNFTSTEMPLLKSSPAVAYGKFGIVEKLPLI